MNKKYIVLAVFLFVLLSAAFAFFTLGFLNSNSQTIGIAFIVVGGALLVGFFGNRLLEKQPQPAAEAKRVIIKATPESLTAAEEKTPSQKLLEAVESLPSFASEGPISKPLGSNSADADLAQVIVSFIFGAMALTFFGLGIWLLLFAQNFLA